MGYSVVSVGELEAAGPGGAVRFERRALGVQAFGINWIEIPPNTEGREHNEQESEKRRSTSSSAAPASNASTGRRFPSRRGRSCALIHRRRGCRSRDPAA